MTTPAVIMMIVAIVVVWGGLAASILYLRNKPELTEGEIEDPDMVRQDTERLHEPHPFRDT
ncbi:methionine/alanine import family NSS transporter small subunit [Ornithinimicrobium cerasi]|uniref:Methionine and alanine importer, small subunit n=1 Tax=Ornithinimicrobium cerasi TaxID=2248773 RepID=A0A285VGC6_9MICO|nr:methionine/alanine import family NSS transporter small subunit [Ornithinimicrobium cerasi]SOC51591.1 Putative methionine and alanine importer, small subunit [Ornithinimicrobium cerasi]